jgi:Ubiquitin-binding domain
VLVSRPTKFFCSTNSGTPVVDLVSGFLTECYDELGTRYQVPVYCLSNPINIVKEDGGRDSPAECSEPIDGGSETVLKLRLSSTCQDVKLTLSTKDTIGVAKKRLQVSFFII